MAQQYPTTVFKNGTDQGDWVVVADPGEQAHAATQGYFPFGQAPVAPKANDPAPKARKARK